MPDQIQSGDRFCNLQRTVARMALRTKRLRSPDGNRNVLYLNWIDDRWNWNANWLLYTFGKYTSYYLRRFGFYGVDVHESIWYIIHGSPAPWRWFGRKITAGARSLVRWGQKPPLYRVQGSERRPAMAERNVDVLRQVVRNGDASEHVSQTLRRRARSSNLLVITRKEWHRHLFALMAMIASVFWLLLASAGVSDLFIRKTPEFGWLFWVWVTVTGLGLLLWILAIFDMEKNNRLCDTFAEQAGNVASILGTSTEEVLTKSASTLHEFAYALLVRQAMERVHYEDKCREKGLVSSAQEQQSPSDQADVRYHEIAKERFRVWHAVFQAFGLIDDLHRQAFDEAQRRLQQERETAVATE